jgi:hypothetical protein
MTRSSEDNMSAVAGEVNQMDVDYGKNFKILNPNDQIKGKTRKHISRLDMTSQSHCVLLLFRTADNLAGQVNKSK